MDIITEETGGTGFYNEEEESSDRKREEKMMDESTCDDVMLCSAFFYPPLFFFFVSTGAGVYCTVHLQYLPTRPQRHNTTQPNASSSHSFRLLILFYFLVVYMRYIPPHCSSSSKGRQPRAGLDVQTELNDSSTRRSLDMK